jgi:hypothetical protein
MGQNRNKDQDSPRQSTMEPAEGSREKVQNSGSEDLGSSSDRAMFNDRQSSEARDSGSSGERSGGGSAERSSGSSGERNSGSSGGGITNRGRDREMSEQEQLPERGHSQSER